MKKITYIFLLSLFCSLLFAQEFTVDGRKYKADETVRSYNYRYVIKADTFQLQLVDTLIEYINHKQNIRLIRHYTTKDKKLTSKVVYENYMGMDSICKLSVNNKLVRIDETKYDSHNRITSKVEKDLNNPKNNVSYMYLHKDSTYSNGSFTTTKVFRTYAQTINSLSHLLITYKDKNGDTLRVVKVDNGVETDIYSKGKTIRRTQNNIVYSEVVSISKAELKKPQALIKKYLIPIKAKIRDPKYISLLYDFHTADDVTHIIIRKNRRENIQMVEIRIIEKR